jgi:hypothetical protein
LGSPHERAAGQAGQARNADEAIKVAAEKFGSPPSG